MYDQPLFCLLLPEDGPAHVEGHRMALLGRDLKVDGGRSSIQIALRMHFKLRTLG